MGAVVGAACVREGRARGGTRHARGAKGDVAKAANNGGAMNGEGEGDEAGVSPALAEGGNGCGEVRWPAAPWDSVEARGSTGRSRGGRATDDGAVVADNALGAAASAGEVAGTGRTRFEQGEQPAAMGFAWGDGGAVSVNRERQGGTGEWPVVLVEG
ncbi:hypothetical protein ZWY2020_025588 [Hordeum vulgare]|nr:hypothetical protein ZWY2020_025588 [Hordeum vulgare]